MENRIYGKKMVFLMFFSFIWKASKSKNIISFRKYNESTSNFKLCGKFVWSKSNLWRNVSVWPVFSLDGPGLDTDALFIWPFVALFERFDSVRFLINFYDIRKMNVKILCLEIHQKNSPFH